MKFSKETAVRVSLPPGKTEAIFFDDDLPGFGLRLRAGGKRTWIVQYRIGAKQRRHTLGTIAALNYADARKAARIRLAQVGLGRDPQAEKVEAKAQAAITLTAVIDTYLNHKRSRLRPRSIAAATRYLHQHWRTLHELPINKIERREVATRLAEITVERGAIAADGARTALAALFAWALREGIAASNPVVTTNRPAQPKSRERILSDAELAEIWAACRDDDYGRIVRLLILTGQRRDEVGSMTRSEIDLDGKNWSLAPNRTKNARPHTVPLSELALAIVRQTAWEKDRQLLFGDGQGSFSGWSKAKAALDRRILEGRQEAVKCAGRQTENIKAIEPWTLHDLRRTCATRMAELGVLPHIIEAVLNHVSGHKAGVAGVYNRSTYRVEKAQALARWAEHIRAVVEGHDRKIIPFDRSIIAA